MGKQGPTKTPPILTLTISYLCFTYFQSSYFKYSKFRKPYFEMDSYTSSNIYYIILLPKKYTKLTSEVT